MCSRDVCGQATQHLWTKTSHVPDSWPGCVATVGIFDGFHRGHAAVVSAAVREARDRGLPCVLVTFDPHPLAVVDPARAPKLLTTVDERSQLAFEAGVDVVFVHLFDIALARKSADEWIAGFMVDALRVRSVVIGEDFRFGAGNVGDVSTLREAGRVAGFDVVSVPLVQCEGARCSSTLVRAHVRAGRLGEAAQMLGRKYAV